MRPESGMLVKSKAGHDKGRIYVVVRTDNCCAYLADGDLRPLRRMKKKNIRHLQPILKMKLKGQTDDKSVRELIEKYTRGGIR